LNGNFITEVNNNNLFVSSGIQWIVSKTALFETGIQFPLIEDVSDGQKTNYTLTLGTRILIFKILK